MLHLSAEEAKKLEFDNNALNRYVGKLQDAIKLNQVQSDEKIVQKCEMLARIKALEFQKAELEFEKAELVARNKVLESDSPGQSVVQ
jgi:hypothetical protein